jgi:hypothetical protein
MFVFDEDFGHLSRTFQEMPFAHVLPSHASFARRTARGGRSAVRTRQSGTLRISNVPASSCVPRELPAVLVLRTFLDLAITASWPKGTSRPDRNPRPLSEDRDRAG